MIRVHDDWETSAFDLDPSAPATGPFCRRPLLQAWWEHLAPDPARLRLVESERALLPLLRRPSGWSFLGEAHLIDYHSGLGQGVDGLSTDLARYILGEAPFRFDSLPWEAARPLAKGLSEAGLEVEPVAAGEATAVVDLPDDFDAYLASLKGKDRHELRRKRRRFEHEAGPIEVTSRRDLGGLRQFIRLHRLATPPKGAFMTAEMEGFFERLLAVPGTRVDVLTTGSRGTVAAAFGFTDSEGYYLYNAAYDPAVASLSPGIVLISALIEEAVMAGRMRFDFLKGEEAYKFRFGARRRPLYLVAGGS